MPNAKIAFDDLGALLAKLQESPAALKAFRELGGGDLPVIEVETKPVLNLLEATPSEQSRDAAA